MKGRKTKLRNGGKKEKNCRCKENRVMVVIETFLPRLKLNGQRHSSVGNDQPDLGNEWWNEGWSILGECLRGRRVVLILMGGQDGITKLGMKSRLELDYDGWAVCRDGVWMSWGSRITRGRALKNQRTWGYGEVDEVMGKLWEGDIGKWWAGEVEGCWEG